MTTPTPPEPKEQTSGWFSRGLRGLIKISVTLGVVAFAVVAVRVASSELTRRAEAVPPPDAAAIITVSVSPLAVESGYTVDRVFIGQLESQRTAVVSFELGGKLEKILVDEGDIVASGQILAGLDDSLLEAEQDRLEASRDAVLAQLRFADQTVERNSQLTERGFTSQARLDEALARKDELLSRVDELDAALRDMALRLEKSRVYAPFAGRITERPVDGGETLRPGDPVLGLVESAPPQVRIGIPLDIDQSDLTEVEIEIGGAKQPARLINLRPDIDPVTRTRTALFELSADGDTVFGQTARLRVSRQIDAPGIWIPTTALKEGVRGQWTMLVADRDKIVRSATVEILHADNDRVFVRGSLPEGTVLIDQGPQRVTVGQRVNFTSL